MAFFILIDLEYSDSYINIHSHSDIGSFCILNSEPGDKLDPEKIYSVGAHPWNISKYKLPDVIEEIKEKSKLSNVIAIGECGLDRLTDSPMRYQEQIFTEQIRIAEQAKKPVIIHCVKAFDDVIRIKKKLNTSIALIIHGYNNNEEIAAQLIKNNFYLSFGKALMIEGSNAQKVLKQTMTDRIFLETDDATGPIKSIFEKAAELKGISVEELKKIIVTNFKSVFNHG
jgi:TatD DNase family protein